MIPIMPTLTNPRCATPMIPDVTKLRVGAPAPLYRARKSKERKISLYVSNNIQSKVFLL